VSIIAFLILDVINLEIFERCHCRCSFVNHCACRFRFAQSNRVSSIGIATGIIWSLPNDPAEPAIQFHGFQDEAAVGGGVCSCFLNRVEDKKR
jgi:hypothetical protein